MLDADGQPDQARSHAGGEPVGVPTLRVRRRRRVDDQRTDVTDVRHVRVQGERLDEGLARLDTCLLYTSPRVGEPPVVQVGEQVVDEAPFRRGVVRPPRGELPLSLIHI